MRAALVVNSVTLDLDANLAAILRLTHAAVDAGADIVVFPEPALTGLANNDDPSHDLPLGQPIPGPFTTQLSEVVLGRGIWLATGLLEREGSRLYDSAVLLDPWGEIVLKYRRIQPQWHGREADPSIYCQGTDLSRAETLGSFTILLCGDLFDDGIVARVRELHPDWLLFPFARCFSGGSRSQERWDREEQSEYSQRVKLAGSTTLMANYLADASLSGGAFGGAMVVGADGALVAALPLGRSSMLLVDLARQGRGHGEGGSASVWYDGVCRMIEM